MSAHHLAAHAGCYSWKLKMKSIISERQLLEQYGYSILYIVVPGTSLSVVINLNVTLAMVTSASVAVLYTMFGQVISVAYTDVIQLVFIMVGLVSTLVHLYIDTCTHLHINACIRLEQCLN